MKAMTIGDLLKNSYRFRPRNKRVKSNTVLLKSVEFRGKRQKGGPKEKAPTPGTYLEVKTEVSGETGLWFQTINLLEPQFSKTWDRDYLVPVELFGMDYYMKSFDEKSGIRVRCTCPDFRHRFAYSDKDVHSLVGRPIPYTPVGGGAPVNPDNIPGHCKHLHAALEFLAQDEIKVIEPRLLRLTPGMS